ncbi:LysR family transcriptional regulator [Saccharopolyspora endophytica]|uniref:LysR family transcriptional regulator n=1 Tax=Saccharopolyspora endophytica TaxID=543886 RepID=A0ABS5DBF4_9PSEU|nr:LysR family transcriptional regulator [Saccharopolyspora endophytica]MBQ0923565.1 LysR family transcriptional regulator [Saccharopolyspora endophytica]
MNNRNIDTRRLRVDDLRYLLALARTGRLVAAASALGVDHTTVSRRISALEKAVGVRLVERGADGWELTDTGRSVAESARPIEEAIENVATVAAGGDVASLRGTVRVTAPDGFGALFVAPALTRIQRAHPHLNVDLITATRELTVHQSGFDLAVAVGSPQGSRLVTEKLAEYSLSLYAAPEYLEEHGVPDSVDSLRSHVLIFYTGSMLRVGDLDLERHLPGVTARFSSTNIFAHLEATRAGGGIGVLPDFLARRCPELVRLGSFGVDMRLPFYLAARRESASSPVVRVIRQALQDEVRERKAELQP